MTRINANVKIFIRVYSRHSRAIKNLENKPIMTTQITLPNLGENIESGDVLSLDPQVGKVLGRKSLHQPLAVGPRMLDGRLVLSSIDGSLHRIDVPIDTEPNGKGRR